MKLDSTVLTVFQESFRKMPHKCPICGCEKFGINDIETQVLGFNRRGADILNNGEVNQIPAIATHCMHCGHIDLFAISMVMNPLVK